MKSLAGNGRLTVNVDVKFLLKIRFSGYLRVPEGNNVVLYSLLYSLINSLYLLNSNSLIGMHVRLSRHVGPQGA